MKTEELIAQLGSDLAPVKRLAPPRQRALLWLACAVAYLFAMMIAAWLRHGQLGVEVTWAYVVQQLALLAAGTLSAFAAFASAVPGLERLRPRAPAVAAAVAMAAVLWICLDDLGAYGSLGIGRETDWPCVMSILLGGIGLSALAATMLRRAAPLRPGLTSLLAGAGAVSFANVEACLNRVHAFGITVLLWHGATTIIVLLVVTTVGQPFVKWRGPAAGRPTAA
jgi:hypothetical protein